MTWTCPNCGADYPDSGIGVPRDADAPDKEACAECTVRVDESELYEVYSLLADATEAAAVGNPNGCASLASDAKEQVKDVYAGRIE